MDSIISTFHIDWKIIIAQAANFAVVFVVLYIFALKPLGKLMKERSEKIEKGITDAKANEKMLKDTSLKYEEILTKARVEADKIFQDGKKEGEKKKAEMLEDAKNQVSGIIEAGKKTLEADKAKMVNDAKAEIVSLVTAGMEKVSGVSAVSFDRKAMEELKNL